MRCQLLFGSNVLEFAVFYCFFMLPGVEFQTFLTLCKFVAIFKLTIFWEKITFWALICGNDDS